MSNGGQWFSHKAFFFTSHKTSLSPPPPPLNPVYSGSAPTPAPGWPSLWPPVQGHCTVLPFLALFSALGTTAHPSLAGSRLSFHDPASPGSYIAAATPPLSPCGLFSACTEMLGLLRALPRPSALSWVTSSTPALERKGTSTPLPALGQGLCRDGHIFSPQDSPVRLVGPPPPSNR